MSGRFPFALYPPTLLIPPDEDDEDDEALFGKNVFNWGLGSATPPRVGDEGSATSPPPLVVDSPETQPLPAAEPVPVAKCVTIPPYFSLRVDPAEIPDLRPLRDYYDALTVMRELLANEPCLTEEVDQLITGLYPDPRERCQAFEHYVDFIHRNDGQPSDIRLIEPVEQLKRWTCARVAAMKIVTLEKNHLAEFLVYLKACDFLMQKSTDDKDRYKKMYATFAKKICMHIIENYEKVDTLLNFKEDCCIHNTVRGWMDQLTQGRFEGTLESQVLVDFQTKITDKTPSEKWKQQIQYTVHLLNGVNKRIHHEYRGTKGKKVYDNYEFWREHARKLVERHGLNLPKPKRRKTE